MTIITTIQATDIVKDSREVINNNFTNLNNDKIEADAISDFETTTQLNARDTANRSRVNHTGTQTSSTISDFQSSVSSNTDVASNTSARHTHSNKALLDTYTQTEVDLADAVTKKHTHSNKIILDNTTASFTISDKTKLDGIEAGAEVNTLNDVIAGTNITIDKTDPLNPVINAVGGGGGGTGDVVGPTSSTDNALARFDSTTGKLLQDGVVTESDNGDIKLVNAIELDTTPTTITNAEGVISWNAVDKTIDINQGNDVMQQVGQEQYWRGKNQTGATISQPSVVYANGALGASGIMTIAKYIANGTIPGIYTLGVTTEDIIDGGDGFITTFGKIRGIDTTGTPYSETWAEGDVLYASPTTAGALTKVKPSLPNITIPIAFVISVHSINGVIAVRVPTPSPLSEDIGYDNTTSGLTAIDIQSAIDELSNEKANDNEVVKLTGTQTIGGAKTFSETTNVSKTIRSTGIEAPASGSGTEMRYDSGLALGSIIAYNRTTPGYLNLQLNGLVTCVQNNQVGIGNATPNASAILQVDSSTKGFAPPRMTTAQRDAISSPLTGLLVYNTTTNKINVYNGTSWGEVGGSSVKQHRITIPGEQIADTTSYQGLYFYNDTGATITISNVAFAVGKAAAGTGAACALNIYKSSGTAADGLNTNAVNLFTTAVDLGTGYTSLTNVPNTTTVEAGRWVTLRVTSSAGATNKASDLQAILTYS